MQHQTIRRNTAGKWEPVDCPCGEDHGPSLREERDLLLEEVAELEARLAELERLRAGDERARATARVWQQLRPYRPEMPAQLAIALNAQAEPYVDEELRQLVAEDRRARGEG